MSDVLKLGNKEFQCRFFLGTGKYPPEMAPAVIEAAGAEMITVALRRVDLKQKGNILDHIPSTITLLPNTAGCTTAEEAVRTAHLARELGCGDFIKIEVIHDNPYLLPDNRETLRATEILAKEGFIVLPYISPDLMIARELVNAGASAVMPLGAPIGSNQGLLTRDFVRILVEEIPLPVIVDAGIGRPSQACEAMEMGAAAVLCNTAVATAGNIVQMAKAFSMAVAAGREAYLAQPGRVLTKAEASSPTTGVSK